MAIGFIECWAHVPLRTRFVKEAIHWGKYDGKRIREPRPGNILEFCPEASL